MTNQVYLVEQGDVRLTVKVYEVSTKQTNPLYPNSAAVETRTLDSLADSAIAPMKLAGWQEVALDGKVTEATLIYEYLDGYVWQSNTVAVAQLLSKLHNPLMTPPPVWLRQLPLSAYQVCLHGDDILQRVAAADTEDLRQLRPSSPSKQQVTEQCFVHGDCWAGNFIQSDNGLRLIDWQCPGVGDAVEDIANFLSPGMMSFCREEPLSDWEQQAFFEAYENEYALERYERDAVSWHWRLACYYLYRRESLKDVQAKLSLGYGQALEKEMHFIQRLL